jgi:ATP-dependent helicase/nuclease subunit B
MSISDAVIVSNDFTFLRILLNIIDSNYSFREIANFLSHPYIRSNDAYLFDINILRKLEPQDFLKDIFFKLNKDSKEYIFFINVITSLKDAFDLYTKNDIISVYELFCKLHEAATLITDKYNKIHPDITSNLLITLQDLHSHKLSFWKILEEILSGMQIYEKNYESSIIATNLKEASGVSSDLMILMSVSCNYFQKDEQTFLSLSQKKLLNIETSRANKIKLYKDFQQVLENNNNVIMTYSKKTNGDDNTFFEFIHLLNINLKEINSKYIISQKNNTKFFEIDKEFMPKELAPSNFEMLLRNPYAFYAKKILKLKKLDPVGKEPDAALFGTIVHEIFDRYNKYISKYPNNDKNKIIQNITSDVLLRYSSSLIIQKIFKPKILKLIKYFIDYDQERRKNATSVQTEVIGRISVPNIDNKQFSLYAILDRLEVLINNDVVILDYKTGSVPTKSDVETGASPQMVLESLIVKQHGFKNITSYNKIDLIFIKVGLSYPYFVENSIKDIDKLQSLYEHGLEKIIKFYFTDNKIKIFKLGEFELLKYNDYKLLERV